MEYTCRERNAETNGVAVVRESVSKDCHDTALFLHNEGDNVAKITGIFEKVYSWENLLNAYFMAADGKWDREEVAIFTAHLEENLISIQNELIWRTYEVGRYREFYVYEPKKRLIMALRFRDRVVQWAIYLQLNPLFDKQFIYHSYGCRVGKGTTRAADRLQYWMRAVDRKPEGWYYLKLDISKYFYRVNHEVLMNILANKIDDEGILWLMNAIINCEHTPFGLPRGMNPDSVSKEERLFDVGMPIGNLTSQLLANICLNELDQYVKHELKMHYYIRYMDDMIVLHPDKKQLAAIKECIELFLNEQLHLDLNNKTTINKVKNGIEFVGFTIFPTHRKLKKKSLRKMKARLKYVAKEYAQGLKSFDEINPTVQSYYGLMKHFNSYGLRCKFMKTITFKRGDQGGDQRNKTSA